MPAFFSSPEFAEVAISKDRKSAEDSPPGVHRLRFDVFKDEQFFELYLIDREYIWGKVPRDVQVTSHGVFTSLLDALAAVDAFIEDYNVSQHADRIDRLRNAFDTLVTDPAAKAVEFPMHLLSRGLMKYAGS